MPVTSTTPYSKIPESHRRNETRCVQYLCELIPQGTPIVEFFGGMGLLTQVFLDLNPSSLSTCELDPELGAQLKEKFDHKARVHVGDTFAWSFNQITQGSFVSLDYNKYTTTALVRNAKDYGRFFKEDLAEIARRGARYVHLTDCASYRSHFHWATYSKTFGTPVTDKHSYCRAVAPIYDQLLGWWMLRYAIHRGAYHFLFMTHWIKHELDGKLFA
jgi:hypothetical protein